MSASRIALFFGLLLITSAIAQMPGIYRGLMLGTLDIAAVLRCRFDLMSGGMFVLVASALP